MPAFPNTKLKAIQLVGEHPLPTEQPLWGGQKAILLAAGEVPPLRALSGEARGPLQGAILVAAGEVPPPPPPHCAAPLGTPEGQSDRCVPRWVSGRAGV
eukprot:13842551-Alexandrium_andersonii.AAC.1